LTVTRSGNVGIGTTSPNRKLEVNGSIRMGALITGAGGAVAVYRDANGDLADSTSSLRYKTNIETMEPILSKIMDLRAVRFDWNNKTSTPGMADFGMIAEEVNGVLPDLVTYNPDGTPHGLKYEKMGLFALKGLQEQQGEISNFKFQISNQFQSLNDKNISLDDKLNIISGSLTNLDNRATASESQLASLNSQISSLESNTADLGRNLSELTATVGTMVETESMIVSRINDHEARLAALEVGTLSGSGVSGPLDLSPALKKFDADLSAAVGPDGKSIFTLDGELNARVLGAESLKLGNKTSGKETLEAGKTAKEILTSEAFAGAKIYITPLGKLSGGSLYVDMAKVKEGESFTVELDGDPLADNLEFNWLIVR